MKGNVIMYLRILYSLLICFASAASSQGQILVNSGGEQSLSGEYSLVSSIGQLHFTSFNSSSLFAEEGILHARLNPNLTHTNSFANPLNGFSAFPNPFRDYVIVELASGESKSCRMRLFDLHGRIIMDKKDIVLPYSLELNELLKGVYYLQLMDESLRAGQTQQHSGLIKLIKL